LYLLRPPLYCSSYAATRQISSFHLTDSHLRAVGLAACSTLAMPSPRRSTRSALPPPRAPDSNSSSSSVSTSRVERNARSQPTIPPHTQSVSPLSDDPAEAGQSQTRRSKRSHGGENGNAAQNNEDGDEEQAGGGEVTRCVCGQAEYPGPPLTDDIKSRTDITEETGGFFIACDDCGVWQHGGCVGIIDEQQTPDKYSCEECDKKSHHLTIDSKGQHYSRYLPYVRVEHKTARKTSIGRESDTKSKKEREAPSRASVESMSGPKRRSTANSRYAYDEDEALRRALAASKAETDGGPTSRKAKRSRDESEEYVHGRLLSQHIY